LYVPPEEFAAQMRALAGAGFHAVTMDQMLANWTHGTSLPKGKPVVVSFDNGYQSQLTQALPVLRQLGWVGVENIQKTVADFYKIKVADMYPSGVYMMIPCGAVPRG